MPRKGSSLYIESHGPSETAITQGFQWLLSEVKKSGKKGLVAVLTKQNLDNIAGPDPIPLLLKALNKDGSVTVGSVELQLFTVKNSVQSWDGPILAIHGGQKLLDAVDAVHGSANVLYIPWLKGEHAAWIETWKASPLGGEPEETSKPQTISAVVLAALKSLTGSVNVNTGLGHTNDRANAIATLETLFHKKADITPEQIRQHLVQLGWTPKHAQTVKDLAEAIWAGKSPKGSTGKADENLWTHWNGKAN